VLNPSAELAEDRGPDPGEVADGAVSMAGGYPYPEPFAGAYATLQAILH
jgi:hypothetical protein